MTPGGGLQPGEDAATAAARELYEETGLTVEPGELGTPVWATSTELPEFRQEDVFFHIEVEPFLAGVNEPTLAESAMGLLPRWWTLGELRRTTERVYPPHLADRLSDPPPN
jgi:8-oxo-dGTP pyrophosphatase MutT (NUDIX family)